MKAKLATSFVFVLVLALSLTTTARPGGKSLPRSASPAADRDDRDKGDRDKDKDDRDDRDRDDRACRNNELLEHSRNTPLQVLGVIPVPGPVSLSFDIEWADPATERMYAADRTNATLDVIDAEHNVFVGQVTSACTGGATCDTTGLSAGFEGLVASAPAAGGFGGTSKSNDKGPAGVVTIPGYVLVGDGNSTLEVVSNNPLDPNYLKIVQSINTSLPECDTNVPAYSGANGHWCQRADEIAYDPKDHLAFIMNDEPESPTALASPNLPAGCNTSLTTVSEGGSGTCNHASLDPYGTWIDVSSFPFKVAGSVQFPKFGGAEQPVWDALLGRFILTLPGTATQDPAIAYIKPGASSVESYLDLATLIKVPCTGNGANGLALIPATQHAIASACGGVVIFNALSRTLINFDSTDVAPGDQVWANPGDGRGYVGGADKHNVPVLPLTAQPGSLGVFDMQSGQWLQNVDAQGGSDPTAFPETNTVFEHVGGAAAGAAGPNVCALNGDHGTGCFVIFTHEGLETSGK